MMQAAFGKRLDELVHARFGRATRFVAAVRDDGGDLSDATLSRILRGLQAPDPAQLARWARLLELRGRDAEAFQVAGELAQLPDESLVGKKLRQQEARIALLTRKLDALSQRVDQVTASDAERTPPASG